MLPVMAANVSESPPRDTTLRMASSKSVDPRKATIAGELSLDKSRQIHNRISFKLKFKFQYSVNDAAIAFFPSPR